MPRQPISARALGLDVQGDEVDEETGKLHTPESYLSGYLFIHLLPTIDKGSMQ